GRPPPGRAPGLGRPPLTTGATGRPAPAGGALPVAGEVEVLDEPVQGVEGLVRIGALGGPGGRVPAGAVAPRGRRTARVGRVPTTRRGRAIIRRVTGGRFSRLLAHGRPQGVPAHLPHRGVPARLVLVALGRRPGLGLA